MLMRYADMLLFSGACRHCYDVVNIHGSARSGAEVVHTIPTSPPRQREHAIRNATRAILPATRTLASLPMPAFDARRRFSMLAASDAAEMLLAYIFRCAIRRHYSLRLPRQLL